MGWGVGEAGEGWGRRRWGWRLVTGVCVGWVGGGAGMGVGQGLAVSEAMVHLVKYLPCKHKD